MCYSLLLTIDETNGIECSRLSFLLKRRLNCNGWGYLSKRNVANPLWKTQPETHGRGQALPSVHPETAFVMGRKDND
jgi:hypothetical protein